MPWLSWLSVPLCALSLGSYLASENRTTIDDLQSFSFRWQKGNKKENDLTKKGDYYADKYYDIGNDYLIEAISKHPEFPDNVVEMVAIMAEESGESIRDANNYQHENGSIEELKEELFQTAAMCLRCLHHLP